MCTATYYQYIVFSFWNCTIISHWATPACKVPSDTRMRWGFQSRSLAGSIPKASHTPSIFIVHAAYINWIQPNNKKQQDFKTKYIFPTNKLDIIQNRKTIQNLHLKCSFFKTKYVRLARNEAWKNLPWHLATLFLKVAMTSIFSSFSSSRLMILQVGQNPAPRSSLWSHRMAPWESVRRWRTRPRCWRNAMGKKMSGWIIYQNLWIFFEHRISFEFSSLFVDCPRSLQGFLNFPELCNNFPSIFKKKLPGFSPQISPTFPPSSKKTSPSSLIQGFFIQIPPWNRMKQQKSTIKFWERPHQTVHHVGIFLDVFFHLWTIQPKIFWQRQQVSLVSTGWLS